METRPTIGALWRKWDLHVHTPASILNNQFPRKNGVPDWDAYVDALESCDMAVLGVADYFTIDGYRKLLSYKAAGRLQSVTLLPNIEFRLDKVIVRRGGGEPRRLNFHVIFSDELSPDLIEQQFLHRLNFCPEGRPQQPQNMVRLDVANLTELGADLKREETAFRNLSDLEVGAKTAIVPHQDIVEILTKDPRFKGKYLLVLPEAYTSDIPWDGQDHLVRKILLQSADLVFSGNPAHIAWCLGKPPYAQERDAFLQEFLALKGCIHGSDAHDLGSIGKPCAKRGLAGHDCSSGTDCEMRYCWVKADPTFEGLRQITFEPEARVRCQQGDPTPIRSPYSVASLEIEQAAVNSELALRGATIPLNSQLVAVAGGRGGGKTAFVDLIANAFLDRVKTDDRNSFVRRIAADGSNAAVTLTLAGGRVFKKTLTDDRFIEDGEIVYIAQGELEKQVENTKSLAAQIDAVILNSASVANSVKRYELTETENRVEQLGSALQQDVAAVVSAEVGADRDKREQTQAALKKKEGELADIQARAAVYRSRLTAERIAHAEARQKDLALLRERDGKVERLQVLLQQFASTIERFEGALTLTIQEINALVRELATWEVLPGIQYGGAPQLKALREQVQAERDKNAKEIERLASELSLLKGEEESLAKTLDLQKKAEVDLARLKEQLQTIARTETELGQSRLRLRNRYSSLLQAIAERRTKYREAIEVFGQNRGRILSDLDFGAQIVFDEAALRTQAAEVLDTRRAPVEGIPERPSVLEDFVARAKTFCAEGEPAVEALVAEAERLVLDLRDKMKPVRLKSPGDLYGLFFCNYFASQPTVTYRRTTLDKLSIGQKATVLLKIYLADGTKPIIIDSHDDHLDNEFIMDELVEGIRQAKELRQVILVSNNGNVVVNSDAEQVVIAERDGVTIRYRAGSLENPEIREKLLAVLEGGKAAFSRRGMKYRLQDQAVGWI